MSTHTNMALQGKPGLSHKIQQGLGIPAWSLWMDTLRALGSLLLHGAYRLTIQGRGNVPKGAALVVANHQSVHDWLFVGVAIGRSARFVMHHYHFKFPVLREFLQFCRVIPIAPKKDHPLMLEAAYAEIDAALANGELVCIWPEGQMTGDGNLGTFRPGVGTIVARARARGQTVPVVPIGVVGLFGGTFSRAFGAPLSRWSRRVRARVSVNIGTPMDPTEVTAEALRNAVQRLVYARQS